MQLKWPMLWDLFSLFPAHAGVIPLTYDDDHVPGTFPRTRGGDPHIENTAAMNFNFSPHTRG